MVALLVWVLPALAEQTYMVDSTADLPDGHLGDEVCDTGTEAEPTGVCTLRAAIMEANANVDSDPTAFPDQIRLPPGTYRLTIDSPATSDDDDTAESGDLDITDKVAIAGVGSP